MYSAMGHALGAGLMERYEFDCEGDVGREPHLPQGDAHGVAILADRTPDQREGAGDRRLAPAPSPSADSSPSRSITVITARVPDVRASSRIPQRRSRTFKPPRPRFTRPALR